MVIWLKRHYRKIQEIGIGLFLYEVFNNLYDYLFYPFAIAYWGLVKGGAIVVGVSLLASAFLFWLYDRMGVDWLGAHALRQMEDKENKSNLEKLVTWLGKRKVTLWEKLASPVVFIALTFPIDPLVVAVHHRHQHFKGLGLRDWLILLASVAAANAWWLIKVGFVVEAAKVLWRLLVG